MVCIQATVEDLQVALHSKKKSLHPARQRFTLPLRYGEKKAVALTPGKRLSDFGIANGSILTFKDLGPQVEALLRLCWPPRQNLLH